MAHITQYPPTPFIICIFVINFLTYIDGLLLVFFAFHYCVHAILLDYYNTININMCVFSTLNLRGIIAILFTCVVHMEHDYQQIRKLSIRVLNNRPFLKHWLTLSALFHSSHCRQRAETTHILFTRIPPLLLPPHHHNKHTLVPLKSNNNKGQRSNSFSLCNFLDYLRPLYFVAVYYSYFIRFIISFYTTTISKYALVTHKSHKLQLFTPKKLASICNL